MPSLSPRMTKALNVVFWLCGGTVFQRLTLKLNVTLARGEYIKPNNTLQYAIKSERTRRRGLKWEPGARRVHLNRLLYHYKTAGAGVTPAPRRAGRRTKGTLILICINSSLGGRKKMRASAAAMRSTQSGSPLRHAI
ncbi:hypothetical protein EVAR_51111_1 [Eumeta japonica]|uniref:Uncharacterized protein n=1 Tax=Eumeta variegata TaxID=151549 RepID=A0A4C1YB78_EUMVA|nr:hypothetical protein EVAR_51111_1 [Eumeta japonica]